MVPSPALGCIQQRLPYPSGAVLRRNGQVLNPSPLPEPYGHNVEIDGGEPNKRLVVVGHYYGCPIIRDRCLKPTSRHIWRPVSRAYARRREQPVISRHNRRHIRWMGMPDHASDVGHNQAAWFSR